MNLLDEVTSHRKNIKYEMVTLTLSELVRMYESDPCEIVIRPDFQRLFRWDREQQTNFIESMILEIPIPPLFCFEDQEGVWELLDGLQRYSTILRFMGENSSVPEEYRGINKNEEDWHYANANLISTGLQLVKADYLKSLEGLTFDRLPMQLQRNLKRSRLQLYVLKRETDRMYKYEVFKRLNSGGAVLQDQELRNCSARILDNQFPDFLQNLAKNESWKKIMGLSDSKLQEAYAEEMLLRFWAVKNNSSSFSHYVSPFLDEYMRGVASNQIPFDYSMENSLFLRIVAILEKMEDSERIFRSRKPDGKPHGPFSSTIFESVMVGISTNVDLLEGKTGAEIESKIIEFVQSAKADGHIGSGTNTPRKLKGRLELAKQTIK